jgi:tetratricopeptide (TPR) repeat protein
MPLVGWIRIASVLALPLILLGGNTTAELLRLAEERIKKEDFAPAESLLAQAVAEEPTNAQVLYRLGYVQYRQRKLVDARRSFAAVLKIAPPAYNSRYFLGRIALAEDKQREAIEWLEPVLDSKQPIYDTASQLASAYAGVGLIQKAISTLRVAIAQAPWDGPLFYRLGQLYKQLGQAELARDALENGRRLQSFSREDVETLMSASHAIGDGKPSEALQAGKSILDRNNADPNALVALGVVYGNANLQAEALRAFELASSRQPDLFQAQFNRGLALLRLGRSIDSLVPLARAVELLPQSLEANTTYGLAGVMSQRYADALQPLERAWEMDSGNSRVGSLLATSYLRTGAAAKAVPILRTASDRAANDPAPLLLLVEALNGSQDSAGALEAARLAQKRFPQLPQAHMAVAQQLARLGKYQEARPSFEETLKIAPGQPEAELGLADTLQKAGAHADAIAHYRTALNGTNTKLAARVGLARSLISLQRLQEAQTVLEDGLTLHPSDVPLRLELARVYARLGKSDLAAEQTRIVDQLRAAPASR